MSEKMEDIKCHLGSLGGLYWIFAMIGAILIVGTTYKPYYFLAYSTTALVVLFCALVWCLWCNAPKIARYGMALITLGAFVFLVYNSLAVLNGWSSYIQYPGEAESLTHSVEFLTGMVTNDSMTMLTGLGGFTESVSVSAIAYSTGLIGSLLFLVSGLMGIMAARRA